jgi:hypothetical protein
LVFDCLDGFDGFDGRGPGTHRQLLTQPKPLAGFTIHPMMRGGAVGDTLIPAHLRNPGCGLIEGALGRSKCRVMALNVQLAAAGLD